MSLRRGRDGTVDEVLTVDRLSYGVVSRLPRVTPEGGATFNGYFVPEGVRSPVVLCVMQPTNTRLHRRQSSACHRT